MTPTTELAEKLEAIPTADMTLEDQTIFALGIDTLRKQAEELERCRTALRPFAKAAEHVPADQADFKVVAYVPAGPHRAAFEKLQEGLTAGNFRLARSAYNEPKQNGEAK